MILRRLGPVIYLFAIAITWFLTMPQCFAQPQEDVWVSKIVSIQGQAMVKRHGQVDWQQAQPNDYFYAGDTLRVSANSRAAVVLSNESVLRIDQLTTLVFQGIEKKKSFLLKLLEGAAYFFSRQKRSLKVFTPFANGVVEGTEFLVRVDAEKTGIILYEGTVLAQNQFGETIIPKGRSAVAGEGQAPQLTTMIRPRDAVQWALYYPPILAVRPDQVPLMGPDDWQTRLHRSMTAFQQGNTVHAFEAIADLGDTVTDDRFYVYRAGLNLSVGRIDQAQQDIDRALALNDQSSPATALHSIIAVVQNKKDAALQDARRAVEMDSRSAAARIALSYALQARFDLPAALDAAKAAAEVEPENNIAWARLAELQLSTGDLDAALEAAQQAAALPPSIEHTQTILGYAYLTQIKIQKAKEAFVKSIALDSAAPLPRLGMGLAKIREGDLKEGRAEIEIAAGLAPDNALIRSYLGKAYFDEKRDPLDERQFEIAKELDPNDPTPWFYSAIRKQTINLPVEALQDLEKSVELNDNRSVYRSKLMLDKDQASRSASVALIYSNLGFENLGQIEASNSLTNDPTNYSAHRWLADSYSYRPGYEISQASETLQSQLFQPINIYPVPLSMIEKDLSILSSRISGASLNEYDSLFARNRSKLLAAGLYGNNSTWGDEVSVSGIYNKLSMNAGQFHYETEGYRENNDQEHDVYNIFAQMAVSPKFNIQAEWRRRITEYGDITLNFDPDDFSDIDRYQFDRDSIRIGARLRITHKSEFIFSTIYKNENIEDFQLVEDSEPVKITADENLKSDGYIGELQYLFISDIFNAIGGVGAADIANDHQLLVESVPPIVPGLPIDEDKRYDTQHANAYLYANINWPTAIDWTFGVSFDSFEDDQLNRDKWNPKFGARWQVTDKLQLRAAAFQILKKVFILNQTIEPTQIAGFEQFYTETAGSQTTNYGFGLDYHISPNLYTGFQINQREIEVLDRSSRFIENQDEGFYQAYLNIVLPHNVSVRLAPGLESYDRNLDDTSLSENLLGKTETVSVPLTIRFFFTNGIYGEVAATYVQQSVELPTNSTFITDEDDFTIFDTIIGYRLPNRYGTIQLAGKNIFDEAFLFQDNNFKSFEKSISPFIPNRSIVGRITLFF